MAHNNKDMEFLRKRMNALANKLMQEAGLDPVKDQKQRPKYVEMAREAIKAERNAGS